MAAICLLDSTVIIDAINDRSGRDEILEGLLAEGMLLACCSINVTEVYMGMRPNEAERTDDFLASLEFYPVTWEIARYAGAIPRMATEGPYAGPAGSHHCRHRNPPRSTPGDR